MRSSLETINKHQPDISIVNDYTPSQMQNKNPVRGGVNGALGKYKNSVPKVLEKSKMAFANHLNNSIDGNHIKPLTTHEYDNILASKKFSLNPNKLPSGSKKDLINQSTDFSLNIQKARDLFNPITGGLL